MLASGKYSLQRLRNWSASTEKIIVVIDGPIGLLKNDGPYTIFSCHSKANKLLENSTFSNYQSATVERCKMYIV